MERFRIAQYGLMQAVALAYGVLACGASVKLGDSAVEAGLPMPTLYYFAWAFRDYGACLFLIIIAWSIFAAFYSSTIPVRPLDERWIVVSGLMLTISYFAIGSILAFGSATFH